MGPHTLRRNIKKGMLVEIVLKQDQGTDKRVRGYVKDVLTNSKQHPRGIKVRLDIETEDKYRVGRVQKIITNDNLKRENFKFYNIFFNLDKIYSIWLNKEQRYFTFVKKNKNTGKLERAAFIFDNKEQAAELIKMLNRPEKMSITCLNRKKMIHENFKKNNLDYIWINNEKLLTINKIKELETKFTSF